MSLQLTHWPQSGLMHDWQILHGTLACFSNLIFSFNASGFVRFRRGDVSRGVTHSSWRQKNTFITMTFLIQIDFPFLICENWSSLGKSQLSLAFLHWIFLNMAYLISPNCLHADLIKLGIKFGYPCNQLRDRRTKRWWYEYYHNVKMLKDLFRTSQ